MHDTKIYLETGYLLDSSFERVLQNYGTIAKLLPEMQAAWDNVGCKFIEATMTELAKSFRRKELTAYLIMHPSVSSCSHPFLININKFLDFQLDATEQVMHFSDFVYHEALHIFLDDNYRDLLDENSPEASPLIKKFLHTGPLVLAHLHLFAIQKHVFTKNGWGHMWDWICEEVKSFKNDGYREAVAIVNEFGCQPFLDELINS